MVWESDQVAIDAYQPKKIELPVGATNWNVDADVADTDLEEAGDIGTNSDNGVAGKALVESPQLQKFPLLLSEALLPRSASPRGAPTRTPQSPEPSALTHEVVDARTPKKIELPAGAVGFDACREPSADEEPIALGRTLKSPPPADPPTVPIMLSASLPPSPPCSLPGRIQQEQLSPSILMDLMLPLSPTPSSPVPALPDYFDQAEVVSATLPVGLDMGLQADLAQQSDMMQWWGADFMQFGMDGEFTPYSTGDMDYATFQMGAQVPPGLPSRGSILHGTGKCRPCAWFWKASGCQNNENCGHCHMCPEGETKARKKAKQTLARLGLATPKPAAALKEVMTSQNIVFSDPDPTTSPLSVCRGSEQGSTSISGTASNSEEEVATSTKFDGDHERVVNNPKSVAMTSTTNDADTDDAVLAEGFEQSPSQGSSLHGTGNCRPCAWFWKPVGCQNDKDCGYCHLCPETELKLRKKSKQTLLRSGLVTPKAAITADQQESKYTLSLASVTLVDQQDSKYALNLASLI